VKNWAKKFYLCRLFSNQNYIKILSYKLPRINLLRTSSELLVFVSEVEVVYRNFLSILGVFVHLCKNSCTESFCTILQHTSELVGIHLREPSYTTRLTHNCHAFLEPRHNTLCCIARETLHFETACRVPSKSRLG